MKIDKNIENLINEEIKRYSKEMSNKLMGRLDEGEKKGKSSGGGKLVQKAITNQGAQRKVLGTSEKGKKPKATKLVVTENELIDIIEEIIIEQKLDKKIPEGLRITQKAQKETKKENDAHINATNKKMGDYVGKMYNPKPDKFPKSNGGDRMKYQPSDAVDEYIENFAYAAGMENLSYDEIEPDENWVSDNIKGSSRTGNNPEWANAEETDLSNKIDKKRKENLYGKEKAKSYNRVTQPVDTSGSSKKTGKLDNMFKKLESVQSNPVIKEELDKMFHLFNYGQKTQ